MKIKNDVVTNFLTKVKCNTEFADEDLILDFAESGIKVNAVSTTKTVVMAGLLSKEAFIQYESIGKIGIQKLADIVNILKTFGEEVEIKVEGHLLTIKEKGRKVEIELLDTSMILEAPELKKEMVFTENVSLPAKEINSFIGDASMNKDFTVYVNTEKGKIIFNNTGKYKFTKDIQSEDCIGGNKLRLGEPFINVIKPFDGAITMCMGEGMPLKILEKTDVSNMNIIVAPMSIEEDK
jgi:hypothetical protein